MTPGGTDFARRLSELSLLTIEVRISALLITFCVPLWLMDPSSWELWLRLVLHALSSCVAGLSQQNFGTCLPPRQKLLQVNQASSHLNASWAGLHYFKDDQILLPLFSLLNIILLGIYFVKKHVEWLLILSTMSKAFSVSQAQIEKRKKLLEKMQNAGEMHASSVPVIEEQK